MPKLRQHEQIRCPYFTWLLMRRGGVWYADGRSFNQQNVGRHSLGTRDLEEARRLVNELDTQRAIDFGLLAPPAANKSQDPELLLEEGRRFYEQHLSLPRVAGGAGKGTAKRYRAVLDKFLAFAQANAIASWNAVDKRVLEKYAAHLEKMGYKTPSGKRKDYRHNTLHLELTTLKQVVGLLIGEGHLSGREKVKMRLQKAESERPYCWTVDEVAEIITYCRNNGMDWLADVFTALACTGLRISELAELRWSDIDFPNERLKLIDQTGHRQQEGITLRQTKARRSRIFPIHPDLIAVLEKLPRKGPRVFYGPLNGWLKPDSVRNKLVKEVLVPLAPKCVNVGDTKGFKDGRLHSFRHYFCSRCANSGVPERMVMEWLGHAHSEMVRYYYHLHDEESRAQMRRLDLLGDAGKQPAGNVNGVATTTLEDRRAG